MAEKSKTLILNTNILSESLFYSQFNIWYPVFQDLSIPSKLIQLPTEFIEFLNYETPNSENDESIPNDLTVPSFPLLEQEIRNCIEEFGGCVFPKMNWSAPSDACWIKFGNNLDCKTFVEIFDLLKGSDTIANFDLCDDIRKKICENSHPFGYYLVLRKWCDIEPSCEFRCFVKKTEIIAICQRNCCDFYPFLREFEVKIIATIKSYFEENMRGKLLIPDCVFDCYTCSDFSQVVLVDFAAFNTITSSLLFSWEELETPWIGVKFRMREQQGIIPSEKHVASVIPEDFIEMAAGNNEHKLADLLQLSKDSFQELKS